MNIGVVLNYFRYFLFFPKYDDDTSYRFITSRHKYTSENISLLQYINWKDYKTISRKAIGDVGSLFKYSIKLGLFPNGVDYKRLCAFYEYSFEQFFEKHKIDLFISGGVSGFERIGLETARRIGIKTLCVWEGMFRPFTISIDPIGMNVESSIAGTPFSQILMHSGSNEFKILWNKIVKQEQNSDYVPIKIVLGDRFRISKQLNNRIADRLDIERIRLPFHQLAKARLSYYCNKFNYLSVDGIQSPFFCFPLQTHTDSNIVLNSQLESIDAYLDLLLSAFSEFHKRSGINLIIKEHPMDLFRKSYRRKQMKGVYWIHPATSIQSLLRHKYYRGTIIVNSTVGIESLIQQKPVLCLGSALYRYPELVEETPDITNPSSLLNSLENLVDIKVNELWVKRFCGFLYDNIQIDGNIECEPGKNEIDHFCAFFKDQLQKSRV